MSEQAQNDTIRQASTGHRPELAYPVLTDEQISRIRAYGTERSIPAHTRVLTSGAQNADWYVILKGAIEVFALDEERKPRLIATLREREFTGELHLISPRRTLADGFTSMDSLVLHVSRTELQRLMRSEGDIANLILQAAIWRRIGIIEDSVASIVLLGDSRASNTIELQRFLTRNSYPHRLIEPDQECCADASPLGSGPAAPLFPAIMFGDGRILRQPTVASLADELGLMESLDPTLFYDIVVVGAGPSGLAAAVYGASEGLSVLVVECSAPGGQAGTSSKIENYLGFPTGVSGLELATRAQLQAQKFGAHLTISRNVTSISQDEGIHSLLLSDQQVVRSRAVIVATGARYCKLSIEKYDSFEYQGIHYAATGMEGTLCKGEEVVVVGGGNSAGQAAIFLSGFAKWVHLIVRRDSIQATMSQYLITRIESSSRITLHTRAC